MRWMTGRETSGRRAWLGAVGIGTALTLGGTVELSAQSLLDRPANLGGTWAGAPGTLYFHFMHRFAATSAPERKVLNTPTFLLAGGLPGRVLVGARYSTNSTVLAGYPNEWEFFGRVNPLTEMGGGLVDVSAQVGYNLAGESIDGEVTVAKTVGRLRVLAAARGFSNFARADEARWAVAGGALVRITQFVAVAGDVATLLDSSDAEDVAWSVGLHTQIPYTPHTLSLHYSNVNTTTLEGASVGGAEGRWGFEFTVPLTLSRYFGGRTAQTEPVAAAPGEGSGAAVEVTMSNRLTFEPRTIRIQPGQTVVWRNTSDVIHTVTADPSKAANRSNVQLPAGARAFDSGNMAPGAVFRHTFTVPGEYRYICMPHELAGGMLGTVIVENPAPEGVGR